MKKILIVGAQRSFMKKGDNKKQIKKMSTFNQDLTGFELKERKDQISLRKLES